VTEANVELVRNTIEDFTLTVERIVDTGGDDVVVLVRFWTVRDGLAVRFRWFASQREALNAVGIYED
jgi:hypothetical protein